MKTTWYGEGDAAWFEPENEADQALLARANEEGWTNQRLLGELSNAELTEA